jgi:branched-subunit amino acid transport protein
MSNGYIVLGILVMALTTYLIRMLPMAIFRKKITNVRVRSFLYYVPYAVLAAMTFPAIFSSTGTTISAVAGCLAAVLLAYFKRGLLTVAVGAAAVVFVFQMLGL